MSRDDDPVEFVTSYEGDALAQHRMPVRDLAPALLALGQAFDRANSVLNGDRTSLVLEIRATAAGSFDIVLVLQQAIEAGARFFSNDFFSSAANIKELFFGGGVLGAGGVGLFGLVKRLKGKKPRVIEGPTPGTDNITLEIDGLRLSVPGKVLNLYGDSILREQLEAVVRPLTKPGIDRLAFRNRNDRNPPLEVVDKTDVPAFTPGDEGSAGAETDTLIPRQRLQISTANFANREGKWKLSDGEKTRWYAISDTDFLREVDLGRKFGKGDQLVCEVVMRQSVDAEGNLKMGYEVTRVVEQIDRPHQPRLPSVP